MPHARRYLVVTVNVIVTVVHANSMSRPVEKEFADVSVSVCLSECQLVCAVARTPEEAVPSTRELAAPTQRTAFRDAQFETKSL